MGKFGYAVGGAITGAVAFMLVLTLSDLPVASQARNEQMASMATTPPMAKKGHRVVLQVDSADPATMNLALNNATNIEQYYENLGEDVQIEVVTFGPGLLMLRDDTSPVKNRIKTIAQATPSISFSACANTQENMAKVEHKQVPLMPQATVVKSGVVRVMELQEQGWSYIRP